MGGKILINMQVHPLERNYSEVFTYRELEFFAEDEIIEIVPRFSLPGNGKLKLFSGIYGPLRSNTKVKVPLWLAILLRRECKRSIIIPLWLNIENLKSAVKGDYPDD